MGSHSQHGYGYDKYDVSSTTMQELSTPCRDDNIEKAYVSCEKYYEVQTSVTIFHENTEKRTTSIYDFLKSESEATSSKDKMNEDYELAKGNSSKI